MEAPLCSEEPGLEGGAGDHSKLEASRQREERRGMGLQGGALPGTHPTSPQPSWCWPQFLGSLAGGNICGLQPSEEAKQTRPRWRWGSKSSPCRSLTVPRNKTPGASGRAMSPHRPEWRPGGSRHGGLGFLSGQEVPRFIWPLTQRGAASLC